jgi:ParB-like chromosome segregation protein Spo0J
MIKIKISELKLNDKNPRKIDKLKMEKLVKSIKDFPEMLSIRPIVVDSDNVVLGGNMRLQASKKAGLKEVPVIFANDLTEEQKNEFIIKDNIGFGEWDYDVLKLDWNADDLINWGMDFPDFKEPDLAAESLSLESIFEVTIDVTSETEQKKLYDEFTSRGYKCRILSI